MSFRNLIFGIVTEVVVVDIVRQTVIFDIVFAFSQHNLAHYAACLGSKDGREAGRLWAQGKGERGRRGKTGLTIRTYVKKACRLGVWDKWQIREVVRIRHNICTHSLAQPGRGSPSPSLLGGATTHWTWNIYHAFATRFLGPKIDEVSVHNDGEILTVAADRAKDASVSRIIFKGDARNEIWTATF